MNRWCRHVVFFGILAVMIPRSSAGVCMNEDVKKYCSRFRTTYVESMRQIKVHALETSPPEVDSHATEARALKVIKEDLTANLKSIHTSLDVPDPERLQIITDIFFKIGFQLFEECKDKALALTAKVQIWNGNYRTEIQELEDCLKALNGTSFLNKDPTIWGDTFRNKFYYAVVFEFMWKREDAGTVLEKAADPVPDWETIHKEVTDLRVKIVKRMNDFLGMGTSQMKTPAGELDSILRTLHGCEPAAKKKGFNQKWTILIIGGCVLACNGLVLFWFCRTERAVDSDSEEDRVAHYKAVQMRRDRGYDDGKDDELGGGAGVDGMMKIGLASSRAMAHGRGLSAARALKPVHEGPVFLWSKRHM